MSDSKIQEQEKAFYRAIGKSNRTDPQAVFYKLLAELKNPNTKKTHWEAERLKAIALMEMDGLFSRGMLQGEKGKCYPITDLEQFIMQAAFQLAEQEVVPARINEYFRMIEVGAINLIHESILCGISPKSEAKRIESALDGIREKLLRKSPQDQDADPGVFAGDLIRLFVFHTPKAPNSVIAHHVENILKEITQPPKALPSFNTLRQEVAKYRKSIDEAIKKAEATKKG